MYISDEINCNKPTSLFTKIHEFKCECLLWLNSARKLCTWGWTSILINQRLLIFNLFCYSTMTAIKNSIATKSNNSNHVWNTMFVEISRENGLNLLASKFAIFLFTVTMTTNPSTIVTKTSLTRCAWASISCKPHQMSRRQLLSRILLFADTFAVVWLMA